MTEAPELEAVKLPTSPTTSTTIATEEVEKEEEETPAVTSSISNKVDDDMAAIFKEVDELAKIDTTESSSSATAEDANIKKVKKSASRFATSLGLLTKDIDSKLGISSTVQKIDTKLQASERTKQAMNTVSSTASNIDSKLHISETTRSTAEKVGSSSAAKNIRSTVGGVLEGAGNGWKQLDQKHGITSKTAGFFSSSVDFLTAKLDPKAAAASSAAPTAKPDAGLSDALNEVQKD